MESKIKRFESGHHCEGSGHRRIASGEMYPESGMSSRVSMTRPLADKSSFGTDGTGMLSNLSSRRCGADPPKNESGCKHEASPSSTHMHECMPRILRIVPGPTNIYTETEHVHQHVIREHVDCHQAHIGRVSAGSGQSTNDIR